MQWTGVDARKARGEGWDYAQGYLRLVARPDGSYRFGSFRALLESILSKAQQNSSWHENVFMSLPWTDADNVIASRMGFVVSQGTFIFTSYPSAKVYTVDEITARANDGCLICQKALATLTRRKLLHGQRQNYA